MGQASRPVSSDPANSPTLTISATQAGYTYAVSGDGQRFLINYTIADARQDPITVVVNWK